MINRLKIDFVNMIEFVDIFDKVVVNIIVMTNKHDFDIRHIVDNKKRNLMTTQNKNLIENQIERYCIY